MKSQLDSLGTAMYYYHLRKMNAAFVELNHPDRRDCEISLLCERG